MENRNVLIVEDDEAIREGVRVLLEGEGFVVEEAENGSDGLNRLSDTTDIVILDIMIPGISGIRTCEEIRKVSNVPVLFLTARGGESDKLIGLLAGGDDYLVKPFSYAELLGRVKALLRRRNVYDRQENGGQGSKARTAAKWLTAGDIRIHTGCNQVYRGQKEIDLTELEYNLLLLFMRYPQKIFSAQNLYESIWGEDFTYASGNTVMVHIRRVRKKIEENPQKPGYILTVWGKGYRFGQQVSQG